MSEPERSKIATIDEAVRRGWYVSLSPGDGWRKRGAAVTGLAKHGDFHLEAEGNNVRTLKRDLLAKINRAEVTARRG